MRRPASDTLLPQIAQRSPLDTGTIADTVAAVFAAPEFNRRQPWSIFDLLPSLNLDLDPLTRRVLAAIVVVAVAVVALRYMYRRYVDQRRGSVGEGVRAVARHGHDPWLTAQELARSGDFTMAAHALYLALLEALAGQREVRLHPSKTAGDYLGELRRRSSPLVPTVRDFARSYELVAYGFRTCDAERYGQLQTLAARIVRPNG